MLLSAEVLPVQKKGGLALRCIVVVSNQEARSA